MKSISGKSKNISKIVATFGEEDGEELLKRQIEQEYEAKLPTGKKWEDTDALVDQCEEFK